MRSRPRRTTVLLTVLFLAVHGYLGVLALLGVDLFSGDVLLYQHWARQWFDGTHQVGIRAPWVYPVGALLPVLLVGALGPAYLPCWLALVTVLDAVAVTAVARRSIPAAMWWLVALAALGPISLTRLDAVASAVAVLGVALLDARPRLAGALLALGGWIKVAPLAVVAARLVVSRRRLAVLVGAAATTAAIVGVDVALGGAPHLLSFAGQQVGRGLQVEAPIAAPWLWLQAARALPGRPFYDWNLLTWEIRTPGTDAAAALSTVGMLAVAVLILLLAFRARRSADPGTLGALVALALTADVIVLNKVGSPQYLTWLAAPVVLGLLARPRAVRTAAGLTVSASLLTMLVDTRAYPEFLALQVAPLVVMTTRDLVLVALLVWAVRAIAVAGRAAAPAPEVPDGAEVVGAA